MPRKKTLPEKSNAGPKKTTKTKVKEKEADNEKSILIRNQIIPYVLVCVIIFITVCYIFTDVSGIVGKGLRAALYGLFSSGAIAVPFLILNMLIFWKRDCETNMVKYKIIFSCVVLFFISVLVHVFTHESETLNLKELWEAGQHWSGGGAIGGFFGALLLKGVGFAGALIISISMLVCFGLFLFGLTPHAIAVYVQYYIQCYREKRKSLQNVPAPVKIRPRRIREEDTVPEPEHKAEPKFNPDINIDNDENVIDMAVFDEVLKQNEIISSDAEVIKPVLTSETKIKTVKKASKNELNEIFNDDKPLIDSSILEKFKDKPDNETDYSINIGEAELKIERHKLETDISDETVEPPKYVLPQITLLKLDPAPKNTDISEELQTTAKKLVDTLTSFKVRTKIVNVSRGPTITRYELAPEEGIRVRAIANLVDDISLNLATTGVRIEAPIPGKSAVGIEVPNRIVATVWVRELIDNIKFRQAPSKITVCLGMDVAGEPIYVDIAKMPHLLIAGATGMGKSVCINSMIVSLLYKSTPDEVKLILIDPKKVELNIYNGIPHLLVPVVSDPKKAAGALYWAVTEMERRFELIEQSGVRDLKNYNASLKEEDIASGEKQYLPQIVIIIDELADLMMTAPDDVEESICRLAQKARAAGMHLIIGTQRPSVDVITGLIKANIPSRIAFTVASQIDSRTIIDMVGAEKLIGRGDMLYAPVGASKPTRVQGAFVSEQEVETVIDFIKLQGYEGNYDSEVIDRIERAAEQCGNSKKGGGMSASMSEGDGDPALDPMLRPAIELAVESGKISTSLIQRRLSLGYGRAAKLIDRMQEMGIVSPPEGQKPRNVLITRQQFMEMALSKDDFE